MSSLDTQESVVSTFISALEGNNLTEAASYLTEDLQFGGWTPHPSTRRTFWQSSQD